MHSWRHIHGLTAMLMMISVIVHLLWHWKWIKAAFRPGVKPSQVRMNRGLDGLLFTTFDLVILSGLGSHAEGFLDFEVIFYGPPLSVACDGHRLLAFREVAPGYAAVARLVLGKLGYQGTLVCVCPNSTTSGDAERAAGRSIRRLRLTVGKRSGQKGQYTLDLLHLNAAGYDALNQSLTPLLLNLAQSRAAG